MGDTSWGGGPEKVILNEKGAWGQTKSVYFPQRVPSCVLYNFKANFEPIWLLFNWSTNQPERKCWLKVICLKCFSGGGEGHSGPAGPN